MNIELIITECIINELARDCYPLTHSFRICFEFTNNSRMGRPKLTEEEKRKGRQERDRLRYEKNKEAIKENSKKRKADGLISDETKARINAQKRYKYQSDKERVKERYHNNKEVLTQKRHDKEDWVKVSQYEDNIRKGPSRKCNSCHNLFFERSITKITKQTLHNRLITDSNDDGSFNACSSCLTYIRKGDVPPMFHGNGLDLITVPAELNDLNTVEERMIAPLLPFMTITGGLLHQDGNCRGQKKLKGNVVTVPTPIDTTTRLLPRLPANCNMINIHLKRRIINDHSYVAQQVRPSLVLKCLTILLENPLYRDLGITKDPNWVSFIQEKSRELCLQDDEIQNVVDDDLMPSAADTIVINDSQFLGYAPGEGQKPVNLLMYPNAEELCFPTLFGGHTMAHKSFEYTANNIRIPTTAAIIKHQIRHADRRFARNTQNLFFKFFKLLLCKVFSAEQVQLRKAHATHHDKQLLKDPLYLKQICNNDQAYRFIKHIPSSPAYWEVTKKQVLAMIRQLGIPSIFITVSPSEHKWPELLVLLKKSVDDEEISEDEAASLTYLEKDRLLRSDPVLVTRYNDERFHILFKTWTSKYGPFKKYPLTDYFYRTEFQARYVQYISLTTMKNRNIRFH